jgi:pilus assembly protein FimV
MARDVNVGPAAEKKLERYGVWVKVEPRDVTRDLGGSVELTDLEPASEGRASFTAEEENLLDDLETGVGHEVEAGTRGELESLDERLSTSALDEELPELELDDAVDVPLADNKPGAERFDDLEAIEGQIGPTPSATAREPEILSRIERELRSIRSDLTALKKELADLRRPRAAAAPSGTASGSKAGFFEEEEDDTIALTGDELDNILNTADITEEAAEEAAEEPAAEADLVEAEEAGPISDRGDIVAYEEPSTAPDLAAEPVEELEEVTDLDLELPETAPAELELAGEAGALAEVEELPALELDGIPETETAGEAELEELPADEGTLADADLVADLEEVGLETGAKAPAAIPEVDLKALHETQETGHESILSTEDLAASDLAELEAVAEEPSPAAGSSIEIDFEQAAVPAAAEAGAEEVESLEAVEDLEEVAEALEEAPVEAEPAPQPEPRRPAARPEATAAAASTLQMSESLKKDLRNVLSVIDELLDALPEKKIREFAKSEHFAVYKKLFEDLGLGAE